MPWKVVVVSTLLQRDVGLSPWTICLHFRLVKTLVTSFPFLLLLPSLPFPRGGSAYIPVKYLPSLPEKEGQVCQLPNRRPQAPNSGIPLLWYHPAAHADC